VKDMEDKTIQTTQPLTDCPSCGQPTTFSYRTGQLAIHCPNNHTLPQNFLYALHRALNAKIGFPLFQPVSDPAIYPK